VRAKTFRSRLLAALMCIGGLPTVALAQHIPLDNRPVSSVRQNLLDSVQGEFTDARIGVTAAMVPRGGPIGLRWKY
jgi:hypothetical protein